MVHEKGNNSENPKNKNHQKRYLKQHCKSLFKPTIQMSDTHTDEQHVYSEEFLLYTAWNVSG